MNLRPPGMIMHTRGSVILMLVWLVSIPCAMATDVDDPTPTGTDNFGDNFGSAVAIENGRLLIGAPGDDTNGDSVGQAHLFEAGTTMLLQTLDDPTPTDDDDFGFSVALNGDLLVVGAPGDDTNGTNVGQAHLFDATTGDLLRTFDDPTPTPNGNFGDNFGWSVAIEGNRVFVGAPNDNTVDFDAGQVHMFNADTGDLLRTFEDPVPAVGDRFGRSVDIDGDRVLIGAADDSTIDTQVGQAHVFDADTGDLLQTFDDPMPTADDFFGWSVDIDGDHALIGASSDDTNGTNIGQAFLFDVSSGDLLQTFDDPTPTEFDEFGVSVALQDNLALIGAHQHSVDNAEIGQAHLFDVDSGCLVRTYDDPTPGFKDRFGAAVALDDVYAVIGAPFDDTVDNNVGQAHLFGLAPYASDCNGNGVPDACDVDPTDPDGDGEISADCNADGLPDECALGNCLNQRPGPNQTGFAVSDISCTGCGTSIEVKAEDFVTNAPTSIAGVEFLGSYQQNDNASIHDRFVVKIYDDDSGLPGNLIAEFGPMEPDTKLTVAEDLGLKDRRFKYVITLPTIVGVGAGRYWVEIYNDTGATNDFWGWTPALEHDPVAGSPGSAVSHSVPEMWDPFNFDLSLKVICSLLDNDCDFNGVPDDCQDDCNFNGILDACETEPDDDPSVAVEQNDCPEAMIVCPGFDYVGTNVGATASNGPLFCGLFHGTEDVWYRYRPAWDGTAHVRVEGPPINWVYSIWAGCPDAGGTEIACNEQNHFSVTFDAEAGTDYYIRIASFGPDPKGSFELNVAGPDCALNANDLNGNRIPDECECLADVDGSGAVDMADFLEALAQIGTVCISCTGDVNGDGIVDDTDLAVILNNLGPCPFGSTQQDAANASPLIGFGQGGPTTAGTPRQD